MGGVRKTLSTLLLAAAEPSAAQLDWDSIDKNPNGKPKGTTTPAGTRTVVVVSLSGGPVTRVEKRLLPRLIAGVVADLSTRELDIGGVDIKWLHFEAVEQLLSAMQGFGGVDPNRMANSWKFGEPGQWIAGEAQNMEHDLLATVPGATAAEKRQYLLADREPTQEQLNARLFNAIRSTSTERVQELLGLGLDMTKMSQENRPGLRADPNTIQACPALVLAANRFIDGAVEALLAANADPNLLVPSDGATALAIAVRFAAQAPPGAAAVARTLALLEWPTLGCPRAEHAAKLSVGAAVTWTNTTHRSFPTEREGTVVKIWEDGDIRLEGASGAQGEFKPEALRLREGA